MDEYEWRSAERLAEFNRLLARVRAIAADGTDAVQLLQEVCETAARQDPLGFVWCATPNQAGLLQVQAAAGGTAYRDSMRISPETQWDQGQGLSAQTWRDGQTRYVNFRQGDPAMGVFGSLAERAGLAGAVVVRIERHGSPWGLLNFCLYGDVECEPDVGLVLEEVARTVSQALDRVDEHKREQAVMKAHDALVDHAEVGIALCCEGQVIFANPHLVHLLGYRASEELLGQTVRNFCAHDEDKQAVDRAMARIATNQRLSLSAVRLKTREDRVVLVDIALSRTSDGPANTFVLTIQDVTERVRLEQVLASQAYTDSVTGLANRRAFEYDLAQRLERSEQSGTALAVCLLDLDNFKQVNDTWGHSAGDAVLREVSGRLAAQFASMAFVGRTGGDEFVLILDGLDPNAAAASMETSIARVHQVVETPLEAIPGSGLMELSMGVALFPEDDTSAAGLVRAADQALYRVKRHRHDRIRWWQRAGTDSEFLNASEPIDPYGQTAQALLRNVRSVVEEAASRWSVEFYQTMEENPSDARVMEGFPSSLRDDLRAQRLALAAAVLNPDVAREDVAHLAHTFGQELTLIGSPLSWRTRSVAGYQEVLTDELDRRWMSTRDRYRLQRIVEQRLHEVLAKLLQAGETTLSAYLEFLGHPLPPAGVGWVEATQIEVARLAGLPGIVAALVGRIGADGQVALESSAGMDASWLGRQISGETPHERIVRHLATTGEAFRIIDFYDDPRVDAPREHGARSLLALPIMDRQKRFMAGLYLVGQHPHQFESTFICQFSEGLRARWEALWRRTTSSEDAVGEGTAQQYRDRLFNGGLSMYVQPVVNLDTGKVVSVEALARLQLPDGQVLAPGVFVPLLSQVDLARLFQLGLDQALQHRASFAQAGVDVRIAVNLPPSCLLLPELPGWVDEALSRHGIEPHYLSLELLETQYIDEGRRDQAVKKLVDIGVSIALDDLGSGYSSLMRLASLPLRTVKIDQGLVRRIHHDPVRTFAVIDALRELGQRLGRNVVAEGLETPDMIEAAQVLGVQLGQGYGLARPMPAHEFVTWAESFRLPRQDDGALQSLLGVAAYDWKHGHHGPVGQCAIDRFLRAGDYGKPQQWHAAVHRDNEEAGHLLGEWLMERVSQDAQTR